MDQYIPIIDIVIALSSAIDLINPNISNHHKRVAYISYCIAKEMGYSENEIKDLVLAGLLHDCGAVNLFERSSIFEFEFGNSYSNRHSHGYKGWFILRDAAELRSAADIIKYHHVFWKEISHKRFQSCKIPKFSHILHLADRIDILINPNQEILQQKKYINKMIRNGKDTMFMPAAVDAFENIASKPYFWFDITGSYLEDLIRKIMSPYKVYINSELLIQYANIAHRIIDFRSKFTATHSIGVAASASALASKLGFSACDSRLMHSAGLMHDLGKLCIPESILEKPGPLDHYEFNLMKAHTYHTYRILDSIPGLGKVRDWAAFHHEKLDGTGYPFGLDSSSLDLGSRILAVSDMFTALTEERPYRRAMSLKDTVKLINEVSTLDYDVKYCLNQNIEEINEIRRTSQEIVFQSCNEIFPEFDEELNLHAL
ncbi:HD-GYP domain-containing protein [Ruminiclostridium papyrosolvens]|uniref:Phosphohydrolase n=1 Tax=Ruminiclostridium papyrosolvens C7 TaxID=1330534 RepID=U4QZU6_9FIRM|nr:HD domain-containing phosphohydrolase [Ruminiclostridium papyrosolvens]EPR09991.1 phosphohydrolase [Ruminiclostridium papyrosolvens C7]